MYAYIHTYTHVCHEHIYKQPDLYHILMMDNVRHMGHVTRADESRHAYVSFSVYADGTRRRTAASRAEGDEERRGGGGALTFTRMKSFHPGAPSYLPVGDLGVKYSASKQR